MRDRLGQVTAFRVDALQSAPTPELSPGTATGPAGSMTARSPGPASTAAGFTARAAWWVFCTVGSPAPRSRNWPIPCSAAQVTARARNARFSRAIARSGGYSRSSRPASARSAA
jgi:hypothetical protein